MKLSKRNARLQKLCDHFDTINTLGLGVFDQTDSPSYRTIPELLQYLSREIPSEPALLFQQHAYWM